MKIATEKREHVFRITLNRPDKLNAFDLAMLRQLAEAYTTYEEDDSLWCAVVDASGRSFTAGLDLAEVGPAVAAGEPLFPGDLVDPLGLHGRMRTKPVVIAVHGHCFTLGIELALACDIRIAAESTRFGQIEVKRGIFPFGGATIRLPQLTGWGNAMRYLLTGDEFGAAEALRIGLVQEVAPDGQASDRALELAGRVAKQAPLAVQATLRSSRAAGPEVDGALEALLPEARRLMATEDAAEGLRSFVERREARFQGK